MSKKFNSKLRSQQWFDNPENPGMTALYIERSLNFGLTRDDFGPNSGIVLFERPEGVIERADRLEANEELPFIIIDAA